MIGGIDPINLMPPVGTSDGSTGLLDKGSPLGGAAAAAGTGTPTTFADAVKQAATDTVDTLKSAEQMSIQALHGNADTRQVVDAVMGAEQSLQAAVAIRDKIVSAYLDVSRMNI
jgi:flagellar hook-basal body complex protein FliE